MHDGGYFRWIQNGGGDSYIQTQNGELDVNVGGVGAH